MPENWIYKITDIDGVTRDLTEEEMLDYRKTINSYIDDALETDDPMEFGRLIAHKEYIQDLDPELVEE